MAKLDAYLEAERRGILPQDKVAVLDEARRRGLIGTSQGDNRKPPVPEGYDGPAPLTPYELDQRMAQEAQQPKTNTANAALFGAGQGASFGFGDEALSALAAGGAKLMDYAQVDRLLGKELDKSYSDIYKAELAKNKEYIDDAAQNHTGAYIAGNIAGAVGTGIAGGATKAGAAINNSLRSGGLLARAAKGAAAGSASGGLYGAGSAAPDERLAGLQEGAATGAVVGGLLPVAGAGISKVNRALGKKPPIPNADQLRAEASKLYQVAEQKGGTLTPKFTNDFLKKADNILLSKDPKIRASRTNKPLMDAFDDLATFADEPMTLQRAQEVDEMLGDMIDNFTEMGRVTKQGKKLLEVQSALRGMIDQADDSVTMNGGKEGFQALKEGRKLWSTSRKLSDIERIIQRAELMDNPAQGIKSGFRTLLNNPNRLKGFTEAERAAIKKAAESGMTTDLLRTAGSRLIPIIAGASGGGLGGTAAASAASTASRNAATRLQVGRANQLAELVANKGEPVMRQPLISAQSNPLLTILGTQSAIPK